MDATLRAFLLSWNWRPEVLLILGLLGGIYVAGWRRLRRRGSSRTTGRGRLVLYLSGLTLLGLALLSPIDTFGAFLFTMHMIQHELLNMFAPLLLLLANPFPVMLWGLPRRFRYGLGRLLTRQAPLRRVLGGLTFPPVAWLTAVITLWGWHHPALYDAALRSRLVHDLQHLTFFGTGLLFWWPVINPAPRLHGHLAYAWRFFYLVPAAGQNTLLAAVLSLAGRVLYPYYLGVPRLWGLSAATDQVIGGGIMWVSGDMMYIIVLLVLVATWLNEEERLTLQREARERQQGGPGGAPAPRAG